MVVIVTHTVFYDKGEIHGPADAVARHLTKNKTPYIILRHPLAEPYQSKITRVDGKKESTSSLGPTITGIVRYPIDVFQTVKAFWDQEVAVFIGVDPLNCIAGAFLKMFGRTEKLVYFTADFADQRFPNPVLNWIYHFLDRICVKYADYCWGVSTRIQAYRTKQGVPDNRNIFIPNSPPFHAIKRQPTSRINMYQLVLVSGLTVGMEFSPLFKAIKESAKKYPNLRLVIIGGGEGEKEVKADLKQYEIDKQTEILGRLPHEKVHEILSKSGVGIALYNDTAPWRYYSDSMKARDYMACGVPVLISGDLATVEDIVKAKAGLAIKPTAKNITNAINQLLKDQSSYETYRKNAIRLAEKFDIEAILASAFKKIKKT